MKMASHIVLVATTVWQLCLHSQRLTTCYARFSNRLCFSGIAPRPLGCKELTPTKRNPREAAALLPACAGSLTFSGAASHGFQRVPKGWLFSS